MVTIKEALELVLQSVPEPEIRKLKLGEARGFTLAEDICADRDYPPFHRACVDGYAVRLSDLQKGQVSFSPSGTILAGDFDENAPTGGDCVKIMTGASLPAPWDVLFKVEDCIESQDGITIPDKNPEKWHNIDTKGVIASAEDIIIQKNSVLDIRSITALAATGKSVVSVYNLPTVAIISTGSEIIPIDQEPKPTQIRDVNYYSLLYGLQSIGIEPSYYSIVADDKQSLDLAIQKALEYDVVLMSGGVSMGDTDYVPSSLEAAGVKQVFHKVKMKPGKPIWFGVKGEKAVFGLPGNPFSVSVGFKIFVEPYLKKRSCRSFSEPVRANLQTQRTLRGDRPEYFPVKADTRNNQITVTTRPHKGSGDLLAMPETDGVALHEVENRELLVGDTVEFLPW
ncbi:MAG: molybdopterin molybdotransferase MoeA [Leptospirales bacterium]